MAEEQKEETKCDDVDNSGLIPWGDFWTLWFQKILRNIASVKYQWLLLLYIPVIWGMFNIPEGSSTGEPWISASVGLTFLGGGFVTLATSRIIARTRLVESNDDGTLDTDR
jgi:hypothetical protein